MSIALQFGGRDPAKRTSVSPGIVRDKTPGGDAFRVISPVYIPEKFKTLEAAQAARLRETGRGSVPLPRGPAPLHMGNRYISVMRDSFMVSIPRLKFKEFFQTREAAEDARARVLSESGQTDELHDIEDASDPDYDPEEDVDDRETEDALFEQQIMSAGKNAPSAPPLPPAPQALSMYIIKKRANKRASDSYRVFKRIRGDNGHLQYEGTFPSQALAEAWIRDMETKGASDVQQRGIETNPNHPFLIVSVPARSGVGGNQVRWVVRYHKEFAAQFHTRERAQRWIDAQDRNAWMNGYRASKQELESNDTGEPPAHGAKLFLMRLITPGHTDILANMDQAVGAWCHAHANDFGVSPRVYDRPARMAPSRDTSSYGEETTQTFRKVFGENRLKDGLWYGYPNLTFDELFGKSPPPPLAIEGNPDLSWLPDLEDEHSDGEARAMTDFPATMGSQSPFKHMKDGRERLINKHTGKELSHHDQTHAQVLEQLGAIAMHKGKL